jgi:hypothetical protein
MVEQKSNVNPVEFQRRSPLQQASRLAAMGAALIVGMLHVSGLWYQAIDPSVLLDAGRGMVFILLSLGLMGTARLSLVLSVLLALTGLVALLSNPSEARLVHWLELFLLISASSALTLQLARSD